MVPRAGARASLSGATRLGKPSRSDAIAVAAYETGVAAVTAPHSSSALCAGRWRGAQLGIAPAVRHLRRTCSKREPSSMARNGRSTFAPPNRPDTSIWILPMSTSVAPSSEDCFPVVPL
jgi:hypothetical protein